MSMEEGENSSQTQDKAFFSFPYEPYDIQLQLMQQLYQTIDQKHVGIMESPTGTGKSISLICGALTWYTKHTDRYGIVLPSSDATETEESTNGESTSRSLNEPSWLANYDKTRAQRERESKQATAQEALRPIETVRLESDSQSAKRKSSYAYAFHERKSQYQMRKIQNAKAGVSSESKKTGEEKTDGSDGEFIVDSYDSDKAQLHSQDDSDEEVSPSLPKHSFNPYSDSKPEYGILKIIYCSRTHSQISQFVHEINKTVYADRIRVISLGSRKNLCVNPSVQSLPSDIQMTDKCLDMLQGSKTKDKKTAKCPFYERELLSHYRNHALASLHDIEDLHQLGNDMSICSYYGARESLPLAQVITMPYSMLLSKATRESLGLELDGSVVILDEAHNIIDAIANTYKVQITNKQIVVSKRSLWTYFRKYEKRLKGKNVFYIKQLMAILDALTKLLKKVSKELLAVKETESSRDGKMMSINDFLFEAGIDHFNLFKILQYLEESELPKKLLGFMDAEHALTKAPSNQPDSTSTSLVSGLTAGMVDNDADEEFESRHVSPLRTIQDLLAALTSAGQDGRMLVQPSNVSKGVEGLVRFILLNPATHFEEIVKKSRSVILAGGTMKPVSEVTSQLFASVPNDHIDLFSCGHVIPPSNLIGVSLASGPSAKHLEFTYSRRGDMEALDELGRILLNLVRIVPGGIVLFFPSYRFENDVVKRWRQTGLYDDITRKKAIFREPKQRDELSIVLNQYAATCNSKTKNGAVLLSVVGGRMSEGINFSDDLARCVVMVGLPYPNARDPELVEKMSYLDKRQPGSGRRFYESLCMKAVNQSIGRSIRHQNDYASIVLVDQRFGNASTRSRLPDWIQSRMQPPSGFGEAYSKLVQFYRSKQR